MNYSIHGSSDRFKEEWGIMKAYAQVLAELGAVDRPSKFRLGKFLNEIDKWSQDKSGHNINLLIIEILARYTKSSDLLYDRTEAIKRYILRHTAKRSRKRIILTGLIKWIESNFKNDFQKQLQQLSETQPQSIDVEIVRYEELIGLLGKSSPIDTLY